MPGTPTTKYNIPTLGGSDVIRNGPTQIDASFAAIDGLLAPSDQGALASRPVSTVGSPGKSGRTYYATDTTQLFRDNGTGWTEVMLAPGAWQPLTNIGVGLTTPSATGRAEARLEAGGIARLRGFFTVTSGSTLPAPYSLGVLPTGMFSTTAQLGVVFGNLSGGSPLAGTVHPGATGARPITPGTLLAQQSLPSGTVLGLDSISYAVA